MGRLLDTPVVVRELIPSLLIHTFCCIYHAACMCIGPAAAAYFEIDRVSERPSRIRGLVSTLYVFVQAACRLLCINKSENGGKGEHSVIMLFLKTAAYYISIHNNKFRDFEFRSPRIHACTGTYVRYRSASTLTCGRRWAQERRPLL